MMMVLMNELLTWEARGTSIVFVRNDTHIFCWKPQRGTRFARKRVCIGELPTDELHFVSLERLSKYLMISTRSRRDLYLVNTWLCNYAGNQGCHMPNAASGCSCN